MGLFSFIGKALGTVAKVGIGIATGNVGGAIATGLSGLGVLHSAKAPMGGSNVKLSVLGKFGNNVLRGNSTQSMPGGFTGGIGGAARRIITTPGILRASPVLPGGAIATRAGPVAASGGTPPSHYAGSKSRKTKRRSKSSRASSRKRSTRKRSGGKKRKLKFGSAAYRKKYLGHR